MTESFYRKAAVAVTAFHVLLVGWGAARHSPTMNEPAHLVAGLSYWKFGAFELYGVNPPLVRLISSLPVSLTGHRESWTGYDSSPRARPEFQMGKTFVDENAKNSIWLFTLARWSCIPFTIIGAMTCYCWTFEVSRQGGSGLLATSLWCGSPMILGHAQLMTPDVAAAAVGIASSYLFWRWLNRPSWPRAMVSGIALGVALLIKSTLILLVPAWLLVSCIVPRLVSFRSQLAMIVVQVALSIYTLNVGYGFEQTCQPLRNFPFISDYLASRDDAQVNRFSDMWIGSLPVPLPSSFVLGLDLQQKDFEEPGRPSYLRGQFNDSGWWYYYVYCILVKVPIPTLILTALALVVRLACREVRGVEAVLLVVPSVVFVAASLKCGFSHHFRYVLPCYPFAVCWVSISLASARYRHIQIFLVCWLWCSTLATYPHCVSYFNCCAGGPMHGPQHLIMSNVDWGQDLIFLDEELNRLRDGEPLFLAYDGLVNPSNFLSRSASEFPTRVADLKPGLYAISINTLYGLPRAARCGSGATQRIASEVLSLLRNRQPIGFGGYSILVYQIHGDHRKE